jgi:dihydrofolate reductase
MRNLKLQVQMTLDGYIAGPNGEMDWMTFDWSEDIKQYVPFECGIVMLQYQNS